MPSTSPAITAHVPEAVLTYRPAEVVVYAVVESWLRGRHSSRAIAAAELARGCGYTPEPGGGLPRALREAITGLRDRGVLLVLARTGRVSSYALRKPAGRYAVATTEALAAVRDRRLSPALFAHLLREQRGTGPSGVSTTSTSEHAARWATPTRTVQRLRRQALDAGLLVDVDGALALSPGLADPYAPAVDNAPAAVSEPEPEPAIPAGGSRHSGRGSRAISAGVYPLVTPYTPRNLLAVGEVTHRYAPACEGAAERRRGGKDESIGRPDVARVLARLPRELVPPRYGMRVGLARRLAAALDAGLGPDAIVAGLVDRVDPAEVGRRHVPAVAAALAGLRREVAVLGVCAGCGQDRPTFGCSVCGPADRPWSAQDAAALEALTARLEVEVSA